MHLRIVRVLACLSVLGLAGCNVLNTMDGEAVRGGSKNFDPYASTQSGAIKLSLMMMNDCAITPTGQQLGKGSANIPYPDTCAPLAPAQGPNPPAPLKPLPVLTGFNYFLDQLSVIEMVENLHTDPARPDEMANWFENLPRFKNLDWDGLGVDSDSWQPTERSPSPYAWKHRITFANANWQRVTDDTITVEVLDSSGTSRTKAVTYNVTDFLVQNPGLFHTVMMWEDDNIQAPKFPGDLSQVAAPPAPPGFPPTGAPVTQTFFKWEHKTSIHPEKQFTIPSGLIGDGAIKVTWSQLPNDPFYFPVTFTDPKNLPATCISGADGKTPVPCTFGLDPQVSFSKPDNGQFYKPGDTVQVTLALKDSAGNYIHDPDKFPTWNDYLNNNANGLLYFNQFNFWEAHDDDVSTAFQLAGPKQAMRPTYNLNDKTWFKAQTDQMIPGVGNDEMVYLGPGTQSAFNIIPGIRNGNPPTTWNIQLPTDIKPGTYVFFFKAHRYWMGERITKAVPFDIQVGQVEPTKFPGRVGNCQLCHRGPISLDNVRHGIPVDYVEGCKTCHTRDLFPGPRVETQALFHRIHMSSYKFPFAKNRCTTCHLTRESALRPSYLVCSSCHPEPHGGAFFQTEFTPDSDPAQNTGVFQACGLACHGNTPPTQHILPQ